MRALVSSNSRRQQQRRHHARQAVLLERRLRLYGTPRRDLRLPSPPSPPSLRPPARRILSPGKFTLRAWAPQERLLNLRPLLSKWRKRPASRLSIFFPLLSWGVRLPVWWPAEFCSLPVPQLSGLSFALEIDLSYKKTQTPRFPKQSLASVDCLGIGHVSRRLKFSQAAWWG